MLIVLKQYPEIFFFFWNSFLKLVHFLVSEGALVLLFLQAYSCISAPLPLSYDISYLVLLTVLHEAKLCFFFFNQDGHLHTQ